MDPQQQSGSGEMGCMDLTCACSVEELRSSDFLKSMVVVNVENPLYPGYLEHDHQDDVDYLLSSFSGRVVLDGPYIDLNLGSPEAAIRRIALERTHAAMSYADRCEAEAVIFQSTYLPFIGVDFYHHGWMEESTRSWRSILSAQTKVRLALCNTFEFNPENLIELEQTLDDPRLEIAMDVGHVLVWGKLDPLSWYRKVKNRCRYLYLHSNNGMIDEHKSIRQGSLQAKEVLGSLRKELRSDSVLILKYFDRSVVMEDLKYLAEILK
jgi:sugar phosphate isomerase/epimerase